MECGLSGGSVRPALRMPPSITKCAGGPGAGAPISMSGVFTDAGVLGEQTAGKSVGMRTLIRIESKDRHIFELYFTPPGEREFLADRKVYTRMTE